MIEESGRIVRLDGDYAVVDTERRSSCNSCSVQKGCGSGSLAQLFGTRTHQIRALNRIGAQAGDEVVLGIDETMLVRGSILVYLLPLLGLIAGGLLGQTLSPQLNLSGSELPSILGALAGLGLSFAWLVRRNRHWARQGSFQAEIIRRTHTTAPGIPVHFAGTHTR